MQNKRAYLELFQSSVTYQIMCSTWVGKRWLQCHRNTTNQDKKAYDSMLEPPLSRGVFTAALSTALPFAAHTYYTVYAPQDQVRVDTCELHSKSSTKTSSIPAFRLAWLSHPLALTTNSNQANGQSICTHMHKNALKVGMFCEALLSG